METLSNRQNFNKHLHIKSPPVHLAELDFDSPRLLWPIKITISPRDKMKNQKYIALREASLKRHSVFKAAARMESVLVRRNYFSDRYYQFIHKSRCGVETNISSGSVVISIADTLIKANENHFFSRSGGASFCLMF